MQSGFVNKFGSLDDFCVVTEFVLTDPVRSCVEMNPIPADFCKTRSKAKHDNMHFRYASNPPLKQIYESPGRRRRVREVDGEPDLPGILGRVLLLALINQLLI